MTGLSIWWATPARAESHFSSEELARSERHHRPLRRVALATVAAKLGLLVVAAAVTAGAGDDLDTAGIVAPTARWSWWDAVISGRVAIGAAATVAALRLPAVVGDAWFEFRFRRGEAGYRPVSGRSFAVTVAALAVGSWLLVTAVAGLAYRLMVATTRWPLALSATVVVGMAVAALVERPLRRRWAGPELPVDPAAPVGTELARLAARFSLPGFRFYSRQADGSGDTVSDRLHGAVPNACALGIGGHRRVVVSEALLAEDRDIRDFVVAHELVHVVRRHVAIRGLLTATASLLTIAVVAGLVSSGQPWSWLGLESTDPLGLPILTLILLAAVAVVDVPLSWASRLQERSADAGAAAAVGAPSASGVGGLYLAMSADLDPPRWVRVHSQHPAPAERLEYLARCRRAVGSVGVDAVDQPAGSRTR